MKKLIAAILTAFLMSAGLVATASSPAAADCPYTNCVPTGTSAVGVKAKAKHKAKVFVKVSSFGNGRPDGTVTFTFVKKNGRSIEFTRPYPKQGGGKRGVFNFSRSPRASCRSSWSSTRTRTPSTRAAATPPR